MKVYRNKLGNWRRRSVEDEREGAINFTKLDNEI